MKIKGNRFVSSFLSCVMIFSLCTPAFASEESPQLDKTAIYSQLEKQGALDMYDIHEAIYTATTPSIIPFGSDDEYTNVYAPDGGSLKCKTQKRGKKAITLCLLETLTLTSTTPTTIFLGNKKLALNLF